MKREQRLRKEEGRKRNGTLTLIRNICSKISNKI